MSIAKPLSIPTRPNVTKLQAISLAKSLFGLDVPTSVVKELNGYEDRNFYVRGRLQERDESDSEGGPSSPEEFILKVTNSQDSKHELALQVNTKLLLFLDGKGLKCPVPQSSLQGPITVMHKFPIEGTSETRNPCIGMNGAIELREGTTTSPAREEVGELCAVRLFSFLPGKLLFDVSEVTDALLVEFGTKMASLHKAMQEFSQQNASTRRLTRTAFLWNLRSVPEVTNNFAHALDSLSKQKLVHLISQRFQTEVLPILENFAPQIIHGDLNCHNTIVNSEQNDAVNTIAGFIDFNDLQYSYRVLDVGIALAYVIMAPNLSSRMTARGAAGHVLAGYQSEWPLSRDELEMLDVCAAARCCQSMVIGAYQHKYFDPTNEYLLTTGNIAWEALQLIVGNAELGL